MKKNILSIVICILLTLIILCFSYFSLSDSIGIMNRLLGSSINLFLILYSIYNICNNLFSIIRIIIYKMKGKIDSNVTISKLLEEDFIWIIVFVISFFIQSIFFNGTVNINP